MQLSINGATFEVASANELREALAPFSDIEFREISLTVADGPSLSALVNRRDGFLMYVREPGDAGFTSRNPSPPSSAAETIRYQLSNGQIDQYPRSWALTEEDLLNALSYFAEHARRPPMITWHDDSR
jgi:Immunity protein Imm1